MMKRFYFSVKLLQACFLIIVLLLTVSNGYSQQPKLTQVSGWSEIESAIKSRKLLREALSKVNVRKQVAQQSGDEIDLGRSYYYAMLIKDQLKEDTLYFRNSAFIDSLLINPNTKPVLRSIMHLMQARRIASFNSENRSFKRSNYETRNLAYNYAGLTEPQLDSIAKYHLERAIFTTSLKPVRGYDLLWLSSVPAMFLFEPDLGDIGITEKIYNELYKRRYSGKSNPANPNIINYPSAKFIAAVDSISKTTDADASVFAYYGEWSSKYDRDAEKQAYIESCIRKYYNSRNNQDSITVKNYENYLLQQTGSEYQTVRATSAFQLFNFYLEKAAQYENGFKEIYSPYYKMALRVYQDNKAALNAYAGFKKRMPALLKAIEQQQLEVSMRSVHLPNTPVLLQASYKNVPLLYYRVVKVTHSAQLSTIKNELYKELYQLKPFVEDVIKLPDPADYNSHSVYLKLQELPVGRYYLLFSGKKLNKDAGTTGIPFVISNIAPVNTDDKFYVLNRKNGLPLNGVKVTVNYPAYKDGKKLINASKKYYTTNQYGMVGIGDRRSDKILLVNGVDTLEHSFETRTQQVEREVFSKEYDDLEEFYDEHAKIMVYTDRGIYRPGQKVYFKAILLSRNPKTGEQNIFNNDAGKAFQTWLKNNSPKLNLMDASNRKIDSVIMVPDDFGSFSGSFVLPKTAITGEWEIRSNAVDDFYNGGRFSVEEYKRPTFEITLKTPEQQSTPGKPFELKLKVNSLSGADLGNVQVKYKIERRNEDPKIAPVNSWGSYRYTTLQLLDTTGFTNDKGELVVTVIDSLLHLQDFNRDREWNFSYRITATAIENSGEQVELNEDYSISTWPFNVSLKMDPFYKKDKLPELIPIVKMDDKEVNAGPLKIEIFEITHVDDLRGDKVVDQWVYSPDELSKWFPGQDFKITTSETTKRKLVFSEVLHNANEKLKLAKANLSGGEYDLVITAEKQEQVAGRFIGRFRIFDSQSAHSDVTTFSYLPVNSAKSGDSLTYYINVPDSAYVLYGLTYYASDIDKGVSIKNTCNTVYQKRGLTSYEFKIPADAIEKLLLNYAYVRNNQIYSGSEQIQLAKPIKESLELIVEKYRKVMTPGAKETFSVSIKTANKVVAAQLMTTIYDAALDKLQAHSWEKPGDDNGFGYLYSNWSSAIDFSVPVFEDLKKSDPGASGDPDGELSFSNYNMLSKGYRGSGGLAGMVAGLDEVVVTRQMATSSNVVNLRGKMSILDFKQPLVIIDGVIYEGKLEGFNSSLITDGIVLKGADATGLYGARAAEGVLVLSTKGKLVLPGVEEQSVVKVRKDFSETAVFLPKIYADKDGMYTFSFTMPESATEWNWKMMAHTKSGIFAYAERKLNTRLNLMVQPHMPRLLYQGDELNLQSRITNMDSLVLTGKAICKIEDAVTGEDLSKLMGLGAGNNFSLTAKSNGYTAFKVKVPEAQVNPLKIVVTVTAGNAADAEEHIIPVMSRQIFVKQSISVKFSGKDTLVKSAKLPEDARLYGVGLSVSPKPEAALINALPWLANYSYDCAEQTFNKMLAHITALNMMRNDRNAQLIFATAKKAQITTINSENKLAELPEDITKVVTPWLGLDVQQTGQQTQLFNLLDTVKTKEKINLHLKKLYEMQNPDGGIPWFTGGKSNAYISNYLLAGFGKLNVGMWRINDKAHQDFIKKLIHFSNARYPNADGFYYAYARSFWPETLPSATIADLKVMLADAWKSGFSSSLKIRLLGILTVTKLLPANDPLYVKAKADLESIRQMAINDTENGMRWKELADQDNLDTNTEEIIELLSMAFVGDKATLKGILQWLMTTRQDQHWATTTGTAAAVNLLMKEKGTALTAMQALTAQVGDSKLDVADGLLTGKLADFTKVDQAGSGKALQTLTSIKVSKTNSLPANGSLTWYYFTSAQNLMGLNAAVKLDKKLQVFSEEQKKWIVTNKDFVFKIGMRVKVTLSIETPKPLTFVQIDDYRAAAFEPVDQKSGQQYQDKISFYQSIRDTGYQIFTEFIPSGKSELSYELKVVQEGVFTNGPAVLSCMYKPEIAAYSNSFAIKSLK